MAAIYEYLSNSPGYVRYHFPAELAEIDRLAKKFPVNIGDLAHEVVEEMSTQKLTKKILRRIICRLKLVEYYAKKSEYSSSLSLPDLSRFSETENFEYESKEILCYEDSEMWRRVNFWLTVVHMFIPHKLANDTQSSLSWQLNWIAKSANRYYHQTRQWNGPTYDTSYPAVINHLAKFGVLNERRRI